MSLLYGVSNAHDLSQDELISIRQSTRVLDSSFYLTKCEAILLHVGALVVKYDYWMSLHPMIR
ncbi:hypothetical protein Plhal304r1_c034g0106221 [Plasmopara halstedii]